jgi:5-methylcytosine-specific restriction endonuclease McrA
MQASHLPPGFINGTDLDHHEPKGAGRSDVERILQAKRVLVLNASWEPMRIVSWQRAILLLLGEKIEVIDAYEVQVRSPSCALNLPSVVRMKKYVRPKKKRTILRFSRQHVFLRDEYKCQYCLNTFTVKDLTLDHVIPVTRGGRKTWSNIVTSCGTCNQQKGSRTPQEAGFHEFRSPKEPHAGFLPDLLFMRGSLPDSWRPYLEWMSKTG